jgi:hypothetical protein
MKEFLLRKLMAMLATLLVLTPEQSMHIENDIRDFLEKDVFKKFWYAPIIILVIAPFVIKFAHNKIMDWFDTDDDGDLDEIQVLEGVLDHLKQRRNG